MPETDTLSPLSLDDAAWLVGLPEETDPLALDEGEPDLAHEPPDDGSWQVDAHADAYKRDPYVDLALLPGAAMLNGFTTCDRSKIGTFRVPGTNRYLAVRSEIAPLLIGFAREFHLLVEPIDTGTKDDWGYACRLVRDAAVISFHAGGLAIDLNALRHPMGRTGTFTARQATVIRALCRKYGLRWGGDYHTRPDPMHVEVILTRTAALALVKTLQHPAPPKDAVLYKGMSKLPRQDVKNVQHGLNLLGNHLVEDGIFGAEMERIVLIFQRNRKALGLIADGKFTQDDWDALRAAIAGRQHQAAA